MTTAAMLRSAARTVTPAPLRRMYWRIQEARVRRGILAGQVHEPALCGAIIRLVQPGWTCLDIGGNWGLVTVPMARATGPTGHVIAFEPIPENVARLRANVAECGVSAWTQVVQAAVTDRCADAIPLFPGRRDSHSEWNVTGIDANGLERAAVGSVPSLALDDYLDPIQQIDLVKIDVEGAESMVLRGMARTLERWAPVLVIECHSEENWRSCAALAGRGYTFTTLGGVGFEGDAWLHAHFVALPPRQAARRAA